MLPPLQHPPNTITLLVATLLIGAGSLGGEALRRRSR